MEALVWMLIGHAVADYPLQGDWLSKAKNPTLALVPGEERRIQVPIDHQRGAALVTIAASAGFRPSAVDPKSRDDRFLGVYVKVQ